VLKNNYNLDKEAVYSLVLPDEPGQPAAFVKEDK
jgi:hypothetical protein